MRELDFSVAFSVRGSFSRILSDVLAKSSLVFKGQKIPCAVKDMCCFSLPWNLLCHMHISYNG